MNFTANILRPILCTECSDMLDHSFGGEAGPDEGKLLDHQPLRLNNDDHQRVQQIPIKKVGVFRIYSISLLFVSLFS
jgi:hypothetical protein